MNVRSRGLPTLFACLLSLPASAQQQPDDVRMIRLKISAGDLPSAESILEVHRAEKDEDGDYILGLAWLARGAALTGDWKAASSYSRSAREIAESRLKTPADYDSNREVVYALGTSIEVQAQVLVAAGKKAEAVRFLAESAQAQEKAPFNLRARIWKRRNLIELEGRKAPGIRAEDRVGGESRRSKRCAAGRSSSSSGGRLAVTARCRRRRSAEPWKSTPRGASHSSRRLGSMRPRRIAPRKSGRWRRLGAKCTDCPTP